MNSAGIVTIYVPKGQRGLVERFKRLLEMREGISFGAWVLGEIASEVESWDLESEVEEPEVEEPGVEEHL